MGGCLSCICWCCVVAVPASAVCYPGHDRMHTEISSSCEFAQPPSHGIAFMMRWLSTLATNQGPVCQFARLPVSTCPWPTFPSAQPGDASESSHGYLAVSNKIEPRDLRLVGQVRDALPSVGSTSALRRSKSCSGSICAPTRRRPALVCADHYPLPPSLPSTPRRVGQASASESVADRSRP